MLNGIGFMEAWVMHYENEKNRNNDVIDRLERVAHFFTVNFCSFVLQDLAILLDRYVIMSSER